MQRLNLNDVSFTSTTESSGESEVSDNELDLSFDDMEIENSDSSDNEAQAELFVNHTQAYGLAAFGMMGARNQPQAPRQQHDNEEQNGAGSGNTAAGKSWR